MATDFVGIGAADDPKLPENGSVGRETPDPLSDLAHLRRIPEPGCVDIEPIDAKAGRHSLPAFFLIKGGDQALIRGLGDHKGVVVGIAELCALLHTGKDLDKFSVGHARCHRHGIQKGFRFRIIAGI